MDTIDFKKEVEKRRDEILNDLTGLIRINSELTTFDPNRQGAPFGEGIQEAFDFMLNLGKRDGFETENLEGYAGHIQYGTQEPFVGMIGHLDVVPAGNDWTYDPYGAVIEDNKMYGRGTEDDKGPTIAAYYAMKILKELDVPLTKRIKLILGNDEETAWRCMRHYFKIHPEAPVSGFIPDADFPMIYAEKGISRVMVNGSIDDDRVISVEGGFRDNMVPDYCTLVIKTDPELEMLFKQFAKDRKYPAKVIRDNGTMTFSVEGISAHGSTPEQGENAIFRMFEFMAAERIGGSLLSLVECCLLDDTLGMRLGIAIEDDEMGPLTNNLGVLRAEKNQYTISLNVRYPKNASFDDIVRRMSDRMSPKGATVTVDNHQKVLYKDPESPLVKTLMDVYIKHTGDTKAKPLSIGGGTFARVMPNVVAYGPHFHQKPTFIHQKNEFIDIDDFLLATAIYTEALYELAK
ncbi:MAG: dipeptidase PepV [Acholeplasmataceae bacterium]|nr:dipeptidase PepV [Acholeplasmataceae bacterium]